MIGANAEASTSRRTLDSVRTRRSGRARAVSNATTIAPDAPTSPVAPGSNTATPSIAPSQRKVRTVPPSAVLDPPTPPLESQPTFDTAQPVLRPPHPKRRRRVRYISSDESSCESSDDDDSSDDEPPWWTFTARGMNKLRAMRGSVDHGTESAYESGRETTSRDKIKNARKRRSRSRSRDMGTGSGRSPADRLDSGDWVPTPERRPSAPKLFNPRPFRLPRRSTDLTLPSAPVSQPSQTSDVTSPPGLTRSNSAPGAPPAAKSAAVGEELSIQRTLTPEPMTMTDTEAPVRAARQSPKRPSSVRRFLPAARSRNSTEDNFTDSETTMIASPRFRAKQRLFGFHQGVPEESDTIDLSDPTPDDSGSGTPTPGQRLRRINANNLRIRLPPPISQHFANGWPHAGSWQDALRSGDVFEESMLGGAREREAQLNGHGRPVSLHGPGSLQRLATTGNIPTTANIQSSTTSTPPSGIIRRELDISSNGNGNANGNGTGTDTDTGTPDNGRVKIASTPRPPTITRSSSEAPPVERVVRMKRKQKKNKRYRPAQVPPTPGGLGFTPSIRSNSSYTASAQPSDPNDNPFDNVNPFDRIDEEYNFSADENQLNEKGAAGGRRFGIFPRRQKKRALDHLTARQRVRRMLFLDARITIYIRLLNLAIVVTLLALAITIRQKLYTIGYPGVIGPSTTLIISYASFTILHVLTAIYREYFGRPIGLWGLRSKMLWVCLDLLFIALWSSATTLAINDFIETPLDCTPIYPWWTPGHDYYGGTIKRSLPAHSYPLLTVDTAVTESVKHQPIVHDVCHRQIACFVISLLALLLYCVNMILSLFRIFETVRRTAQGPNRVSTASV